ncbi:hypothetical protein [Peribacillus glennii]|uniref:Uncharacterized protein n=1 Tax=Peribacillus glennii TaxID=2303991 RepID=A0A372L9G6_9BACI|nr:hypothetical protein [Peribacillus glennii]RFU61976.1 hypothetical protein D0466_15385 [Peribacillus glennii]
MSNGKLPHERYLELLRQLDELTDELYDEISKREFKFLVSREVEKELSALTEAYGEEFVTLMVNDFISIGLREFRNGDKYNFQEGT